LVLCASSLQAKVLVPGDSYYLDHKASGIGDLVTIIIVENSKASQQAATNTGKAGEVGVSPSGGLLNFIPIFGARGESKSDSKGSTTRGGSINARVTARVVEIEPGGALVLEGKQRIVVNKEQQEIMLRGVVRPEDISPDNTVLSTFLADAQIEYKGEGSIGGKRQSPGLITNFFGLFDWLF
jgi:flagellar L-ring protein precursor FlgH